MVSQGKSQLLTGFNPHHTPLPPTSSWSVIHDNVGQIIKFTLLTPSTPIPITPPVSLHPSSYEATGWTPAHLGDHFVYSMAVFTNNYTNSPRSPLSLSTFQVTYWKLLNYWTYGNQTLYTYLICRRNCYLEWDWTALQPSSTPLVTYPTTPSPLNDQTILNLVTLQSPQPPKYWICPQTHLQK